MSTCSVVKIKSASFSLKHLDSSGMHLSTLVMSTLLLTMMVRRQSRLLLQTSPKSQMQLWLFTRTNATAIKKGTMWNLARFKACLSWITYNPWKFFLLKMVSHLQLKLIQVSLMHTQDKVLLRTWKYQKQLRSQVYLTAIQHLVSSNVQT